MRLDRGRRPFTSSRQWPTRPSLVVLAAAYSVVASQLAPYTTPIRIATALPCVAVTALAISRGWHHRQIAVEPVEHLRPLLVLAVWAVLLAAALAFQLGLYLSSPRPTYPTISSLAETAFRWPGIRALAFVAWLGLGWYLVER